VVQAEAMAESGIVAGLLAAPLMGVVTKEDADSAVVIDLARNILGNPYAPDGGLPVLPAAPDEPDTAPSDSHGDGDPDLTAPSGQSPSDDGGGVTGTRQVGGGPVAGLGLGDQKSGLGAEASSGPSASSTTDGNRSNADGSGSGGATGVADTGDTGDDAGPSNSVSDGTPEGGVTSEPGADPDGEPSNSKDGTPTPGGSTGTGSPD
jgi:hypothetical protein